MFGALFSSFTEHLLGATILFFVFFLAFGLIFSGGELLPFLTGMLRVVVSTVYSPFIFLRRSTQTVIRFATRGEADYVHSEQYLLNKLLLWWQAVVIVVAMAWLSVGIVRTWYALLPPEEVRNALQSTRDRLADEQQQLVAATADVSRLDNEWNQRKDQLLASYRSQRETTIREMGQQNSSISGDIQRSGNALAINDFGVVERYAASGSPERAEGFRRDLYRWIDQQYYLDDASKSQLRLWTANWYRSAQAKFELTTVSLTTLRQTEQPTYNQALNRKSQLEFRVPETERTVQQLQESARLRWGGALLTLTVSVIQFLFAVWLFGIVTEGLALMIRLADHVKVVRYALSPDPQPSSGEAGYAPRLPIISGHADQVAIATS